MAQTSKKQFGRLYGEVDSAEDIRRINRIIRQEMNAVTTREELTELKKRSDYLCTLTYSPAWRKHFGDKVHVLRRVAMEENGRTVVHANRIAAKHGWPADYDPWGHGNRLRASPRSVHSSGRARVRTHYPSTTARYSGGGKLKYLLYRSPQPLPSGATQLRTRVKRVYLPRSARDIRMEGPKMALTRTGERVYGVVVRYQERLGPTRARRNSTTFTLPARWMERRHVIRLPRNAKTVRLTDRAPEGPLQAVA
jgi:hypothetical protein